MPSSGLQARVVRQRELLRPFESLGMPLLSIAEDSMMLWKPTARDARRILPVGRRNAVLARFQMRCALCSRQFGVDDASPDVHHIAFYAEGGATSEENLIPLCRERCHLLAHLGVWPRTHLWALVASPEAERNDDLQSVSEDEFRGDLQLTVDSPLTWNDRIGRLHQLWLTLPTLHRLPLSRLLELAGRVQWEISKVLTTYGPAGVAAGTEWGQMPLNRYVGLRLNAQATRAVVHAKRAGASGLEPLMEAITHSTSAHWRGIGAFDRSARAFDRHSRTALVNRQLGKDDLAWRSYVLVGRGLDEVRPARFQNTNAAVRGRRLVDKALELSLASGDSHHIIDTSVRQAESRIYSGIYDEGLEMLDDVADAAAHDVPIIEVIVDKLRAVALSRIGDPHGASIYKQKALLRAQQEGLDDQARKIEALHAE